ncbi:MAG: hypothetical protein SFW62_00345 [Alphaproteobacteria bacterium]|nr:hypothetical protein [Alphaproteobacteria bacterium]
MVGGSNPSGATNFGGQNMDSDILTHTPSAEGDEDLIWEIMHVANRGAPLKGDMPLCDAFRVPWRNLLCSSFYKDDSKGCKKGIFGNIELIVLRDDSLVISGHGLASIAVLHDTRSGNFLVLWGEVQKNNFARGILEFRVSRRNAMEDVRRILTDWRTGFDETAVQAGWKSDGQENDYDSPAKGCSWYDVRDSLGKLVTPVSLDDYVQFLVGTDYEKPQRADRAAPSSVAPPVNG